jgi:hypothetical protein
MHKSTWKFYDFQAHALKKVFFTEDYPEAYLRFIRNMVARVYDQTGIAKQQCMIVLHAVDLKMNNN